MKNFLKPLLKMPETRLKVLVGGTSSPSAVVCGGGAQAAGLQVMAQHLVVMFMGLWQISENRFRSKPTSVG